MNPHPVVTAFLARNDDILLVLRSDMVDMPGVWGAVSGSMEGIETPLSRAVSEITEELGLPASLLDLRCRARPVLVKTSRYPGQSWLIHPFLFRVGECTIRLNWENSAYAWVRRSEISRYDTAPCLEAILSYVMR